MANAQQIQVAHNGFGEWLRQVTEAARDTLERRRVYRRTVSELSALSNRDLGDLGISRSMIRGLAKETAYGA